MGAFAVFGFYYKGKYYICEHPCSSYPSNFGQYLVGELLKADFDEWAKLLDNIKEVFYDVPPTPEDIKKLEEYTHLPSYKKAYDWDSLLAGTKGSFKRILESGYIINIAHLPSHDDYIYILDLDNKEFRCKGEGVDVVRTLERRELNKLAKEWTWGYSSGGDSSGDSDSEYPLDGLEEEEEEEAEL